MTDQPVVPEWDSEWYAKVKELNDLVPLKDGWCTKTVDFGYKHQEGSSVHSVVDFGNIKNFIDKVRNAALEEAAAATEKGKSFTKPTHGSCCTCQECGHYHDECACEKNRIITAAADAIRSLKS